MSSEAQVALIVGIIAAVSGLVGALGGTALGWWLNVNAERRTEKRAAFVELLSAIDGCQHTAIVLHTAVVQGWDKQDLDRQRDLMNAALGRVDTAVTVACLVIDDEPTLRAGMTACIDELDMAQRGDEYKSVLNPAYSEILALAKKELR
jgi:hypothetical protein